MVIGCTHLNILTFQSIYSFTVSNCDGGWANWGECSHSCGASTRTRYAYCKTHVACDDVMMETEACLLGPCAGNEPFL